MTATAQLPARRPSVLRAVIFGFLIALVAAGAIFSLRTVLPLVLEARAVITSGAPDEAPPITAVGNVVGPAGGTFVSADATVKVGELNWGQSAEVAAIDRLQVTIPDEWEWVLAPVTVTADAGGDISTRDIRVTLLAGQIMMDHRYKAEHQTPNVPLPNEFVAQTIPAGETRTGNLGWLVPSAARSAGTCMIEVTVGVVSSTFLCSASR